MSEQRRDFEAELGAIMDALAESVAEASDIDVIQETRDEGESPRAVADRVRNVLQRAAIEHRDLVVSAARPRANRLPAEAESNIVPPVELAFATKSLRQLCEARAKADRHLGVAVAEKLRRRLSDLRAATTLNDLVAGKPRALGHGSQRCLAIQLGEGARLVFGPNHPVMPVLPSGDVDWASVTRVKILRIEHDDR